MTTAYIALGTNLARRDAGGRSIDRASTIRAALARLDAVPGVRVGRVSSLVETEPVGGPPGHPPYLNAVARLETSLPARALLEAMLGIEASLGRVRTERWGPRTIDLDLLLHGREGIDGPGLVVPHPRLLDRAFVTGPLGEIAGDVLDALRAGRYTRPAMREIPTIAAARGFSQDAHREGRTVGFVPTMGALHEGHLTLVRRARAECDLVVASVFVNPLQFGPGEDFARYPRDLEGDRAMLAGAGCDALFTTTPEAMYPTGFETYVVQEGLVATLEGAIRPGHFRGVLTVVLKLFLVVAPDRSYFGQKDFQQTVVLRRMVEDLAVPTEVVVCPTAREADGLAMSSRNRYLSPGERAEALCLSRGLTAAQALFAGGTRDAAALRAAIEAELRPASRGAIDYVAIVEPRTLEPRAVARPGDCAVLAVRFGKTRLLDNAFLGA